MAGLGKFLKQAQKMQQKVEATQAEIEAHELDVSSGGGAVKIKINGAGKFLALEVDPELLKEEASLVNESILAAVQDAAQQAKDYNDEKMKSATAGFQMPGMM
jgi:nucleoid-associated protein EbfC